MPICATCGTPVVRAATHCRLHQQNGPRAKPVGERFWASVSIGGQDDCWNWMRSRDRKGYGKFGVGSMKDGTRRIEIASRMAWIVTNGEIPSGMFVCHRCDNPPCCNPSHLYLGSCADNLREMHEKGRYIAKTWLTSVQVAEIRTLLSSQSNASIARIFGVSPSAISRIRSGKSYSRVD